MSLMILSEDEILCNDIYFFEYVNLCLYYNRKKRNTFRRVYYFFGVGVSLL